MFLPLICLPDLEELLSLMHDRPIGQMVRCSKVRAMFASRACRKSIMIGDSLNRQQMVKVRKDGYELVRETAYEDHTGSPTHGYDRTTVELPPRTPDHATPL